MASRGPRARLLLIIAVTAFAAGHVRAGENPAAPTAEAAKGVAAAPGTPREAGPTATLRVFNRPVFTFRAPLYGAAPPERARRAGARIASLLEDAQGDQVTVETEGTGNAVKIDGRVAFIVTEADVDAAYGETVATATKAAVERLELAIGETREARDGRRMLANAMWAGGATIAYVLLLVAFRFVGRVVTRRMLMLAEAAVGKVRIGGAELLTRARALHFARQLLRLGFVAIVLLLTYQWVGFVLGRFPFTRAWGERLNEFLVSTAVGMLTAIAESVPELLIAAVIFVIARMASGVLGRFFDGVQSHRINLEWLDADSAQPTRRLAIIAVWVFALAMAYPYIPGSRTEAFKGVSVLLGLMISIGASGIVGQAASGLILMYTKTFRPGEYVRLGDHEGTIVEMGMFTTRIRTGLGEELTVPNSFALGVVSKNYSRTVKGVGFVLDTTVTIG
jgi:small-conductance mechanosensitive channel